MKSIAFPCLGELTSGSLENFSKGTGGFAYPRENACKTALKTFREWLDSGNTGEMEKIILSVMTEKDQVSLL